MPDYRKLHNRAGQSRKLAALTDFEFRVWLQYRASADDFGVCPFLAAKLQGDNRALAKRPAAMVFKAMKRTLEVELTVIFTHQDQPYLCQLDWQNFEDLRYPRQTIFPPPTVDIFRMLTRETSDLFLKHHGKIPESFRSLARASAPETQTLTQTPTLTLAHTRVEGEGAGEGGPEPDNVWTRLVAALEVGEHSRGVWFIPCVLLREYQDRLVIGVPNTLFLEWLPTHYTKAIAAAVATVCPGKRVDFELASQRRAG